MNVVEVGRGFDADAFRAERAQLGALVVASPLPALLMDLPSGHLLVASAAAQALLAPGGGGLEGFTLEDFAIDTPSGGLELLHEGRINAYETVRSLKTRDGLAPYRLWLKTADSYVPARSAFVVIASEPVGKDDLLALSNRDDWIVVGSTDRALLIDGISSDVGETLGIDPDSLLGVPLFAMVTPSSVVRVLAALAQTTDTRHAGTARVTLRTERATPLRCLMLVLPLEPRPRCTFAFVPFGWPTAAALDARGFGILQQLVRRSSLVDPVDVALSAAHPVVGVSRLSARELEIVNQLLAGDRVPAIAMSLFLAQSTVRNHLSSAFAKLRVSSQQELLDLFHARADPPTAE